MLGAYGKVSVDGGNQVDWEDMSGQGPMGYFPLDNINEIDPHGYC
jgi:hypothetical protein